MVDADALVEDLQVNASLVQVADEVDQVPHGSAEPVELGHDELVAGASVVESLVELRPARELPARPVDEDALTGRLAERVDLGVGVLIAGGLRIPAKASTESG